jgi:hypothetical protein
LRRTATLILLVSVLALAVVVPAHAEGGSSIASAPTIVPGQQEFGKLASHDMGGCGTWWLLPATSGDAIQLDWEVGDRWVVLSLYAPGTNDFNFPQTRPLANGQVNGNGKAELTYTAQQTGNIPLFLRDPGCYGSGVPGPYSFTAYITHALNLALPNIRALRKTGTLTVAVHNPEGGPINDPAVHVELQITGRGGWQRIGVATVANSAATIAFKVPARLRRQHVTLRALAHGTGYAPASSRHLKVRTL